MLNLRLLLFAAGLVNSLAAQQHAVVVDKEPLPSKPPQTAPEPRRKLETNPDEMMPLLISNDAAQRRLALERLDVSWFPEGLPTDVRHFALNLDSSEDFERVLMISSSGQSVAIVFKRENGVWWDIGSFGCCWPGTGRDFHVEFKQTVWSGTNDLVVRASGSHGTGIGETRLSIYRVWNGRLYKVFDIAESAYNMAGEETSRVVFSDENASGSARQIAVQRTQESKGRHKQTCIHYVWDAERFVFAKNPPRVGACK